MQRSQTIEAGKAPELCHKMHVKWSKNAGVCQTHGFWQHGGMLFCFKNMPQHYGMHLQSFETCVQARACQYNVIKCIKSGLGYREYKKRSKAVDLFCSALCGEHFTACCRPRVYQQAQYSPWVRFTSEGLSCLAAMLLALLSMCMQRQAHPHARWYCCDDQRQAKISHHFWPCARL